jgi:hypothetical protein
MKSHFAVWQQSFIPLLMAVFLVLSHEVSAFESDCYDHSYTYGNAVASSEICVSSSFDGYSFKEGDYIDVSCNEGSKLYVADSLNCDSNGCSGEKLPASDRYYLSNSDDNILFICWNRADVDGDFAWCYAYFNLNLLPYCPSYCIDVTDHVTRGRMYNVLYTDCSVISDGSCQCKTFIENHPDCVPDEPDEELDDEPDEELDEELDEEPDDVIPSYLACSNLAWYRALWCRIKLFVKEVWSSFGFGSFVPPVDYYGGSGEGGGSN